MALESGAVDVKVVVVPHDADLPCAPRGPQIPSSWWWCNQREVHCLKLVLVYARPGAAGPAVFHRWTDIVASSAVPVVVMGDFNKDTLRDPQLSRVVEEWGYRVHPPRWAWVWHGAGAHARQHSMIDFVLVPERLPLRERRLVGCMPVRTDHRLVVVEIARQGGGGARLGVLPRNAQVP